MVSTFHSKYNKLHFVFMMAMKNISIQAIHSWKSKRTAKFHFNLPEVVQVTTDNCYPHLNFSLPKLFSTRIQEDFLFPPIQDSLRPL